MKIVFNKDTKLFTRVHHYTGRNAAKNIAMNGFQQGNGTYNRPVRPGGISFFESGDDYIKNDDYDLSEMLDSFEKRAKDESGEFNQKVFKNYIKDEFLPNSEVGNLSTQNYYKNDDEVNNSELAFQNPYPVKEGVHYPKGYVQLSHVANLIHSRNNKNYIPKNNRNPIYRVIADTKNDDDIYTIKGLNEQRVPVDNIDNSTVKLEIPKGMYKGNKKLTRKYIWDNVPNQTGNYIPDDKYNTDDIPTSEALTDIKRKREFLSKGHGKH